MEVVGYLVSALAAYLLGSLPTGYLAGRARGVDIRKVGSGNIGATNVFRALGLPAGILVLAVDTAKGYVACALLAPALGGLLEGGSAGAPAPSERLAITAGLAAILGHNYTCWLRFRGGKGVATTAGVLLALFPKAFPIGLAAWLLVFALTRYVSVASMAAALVLPLAVWGCGASPLMIGVAIFLGALAIFKHKPNIQRLARGTEPRVGGRKTPPTPAPAATKP